MEKVQNSIGQNHFATRQDYEAFMKKSMLIPENFETEEKYIAALCKKYNERYRHRNRVGYMDTAQVGYAFELSLLSPAHKKVLETFVSENRNKNISLEFSSTSVCNLSDYQLYVLNIEKTKELLLNQLKEESIFGAIKLLVDTAKGRYNELLEQVRQKLIVFEHLTDEDEKITKDWNYVENTFSFTLVFHYSIASISFWFQDKELHCTYNIGSNKFTNQKYESESFWGKRKYIYSKFAYQKGDTTHQFIEQIVDKIINAFIEVKDFVYPDGILPNSSCVKLNPNEYIPFGRERTVYDYYKFITEKTTELFNSVDESNHELASSFLKYPEYIFSCLCEKFRDGRSSFDDKIKLNYGGKIIIKSSLSYSSLKDLTGYKEMYLDFGVRYKRTITLFYKPEVQLIHVIYYIANNLHLFIDDCKEDYDLQQHVIFLSY